MAVHFMLFHLTGRMERVSSLLTTSYVSLKRWSRLLRRGLSSSITNKSANRHDDEPNVAQLDLGRLLAEQDQMRKTLHEILVLSRSLAIPFKTRRRPLNRYSVGLCVLTAAMGVGLFVGLSQQAEEQHLLTTLGTGATSRVDSAGRRPATGDRRVRRPPTEHTRLRIRLISWRSPLKGV